MDISTINNTKYGIYPTGLLIRGKLNSEWIYRVRSGNGYFGSISGRKYQDKYAYFVPSSINNPQSEPYRQQLKTAVSYWKNTLTEEEKENYNKEATKNYTFSGYNLFMRDAMRGEYHMFVDRGDPLTQDFELTDLTLNGSWQDLDLSGIITDQTRAILIAVQFESTVTDKYLEVRKKGNSNEENTEKITTQEANIEIKPSIIVSPDSNKTIQYKGASGNITTLNLTIRGWWT